MEIWKDTAFPAYRRVKTKDILENGGTSGVAYFVQYGIPVTEASGNERYSYASLIIICEKRDWDILKGIAQQDPKALASWLSEEVDLERRLIFRSADEFVVIELSSAPKSKNSKLSAKVKSEKKYSKSF